MRGITIARVGDLTIPVLTTDLTRVASMLRRSADQGHLADQIVAGLTSGGELELEPRTPAEKSALELVLTELTWEEPRGRLLPRLRSAVADYEVREPAPTAVSAGAEPADDAPSAAEAERTWRTQLRSARGEIEPKKIRARGGKRPSA
jgi:hypothetical protein